MRLYSRFSVFFSASILATFLGACSDESSLSSTNDEQITSSAVDEVPASSADVPSSSAVDGTPSSSADSVTAGDTSSPAESSSSVQASSSSNPADGVWRVPEGGVFRWVGADDGSRAITGLDNGTETSGYWYWYADRADGGLSSIEWPEELAWDDWDLFAPIVEECKGICGTFTLDQGSLDYKPFVGLGFDLAGTETPNGGSATPADISAWGGLCVAYSSTTDIELYLSYGDAKDAAMGYDFPSVTMPISTEGTVECYRWNQFGIGWGVDPHMDQLVKGAASVKFRIQGKSGTTGEFNIMSVSSYVER